MIILAIETSCDDTCIAVLKIENCKLKILSNIVSSQVKIHAKYGGVYPALAKREHQQNLPIVLKKALEKADIANSKIDLIAVTVGPGLEPCLWTGINFAKDLAKKLELPIIPVNHIEAHIAANFIGGNSKSEIRPQPIKNGLGRPAQNFGLWQNPKLFPAVCLVVSGGHTQLILMKDFGNYKILGETRDDAAGECFDKIARILGLGYPGGPAIAAEAAKFSISNFQFSIKLPRPMIYQRNYDFSFSGLKTAVLYKVRSMKYEDYNPPKDGSSRYAGSSRIPTASSRKRASTKKREFIQKMCKEAQQAIIDVLIKKTIQAANDYKAKTIILGGGVVSNYELRKQFKDKIKTINYKVNFLVPPKKFCTDNAAMVAATAYFRSFERKNKNWEKIEANANLRL